MRNISATIMAANTAFAGEIKREMARDGSPVALDVAGEDVGAGSLAVASRGAVNVWSKKASFSGYMTLKKSIDTTRPTATWVI